MTPKKLERAVAGFMARQLGCQPDRVIRVDSFATNVVYEVDAGGRRFVVKASTGHDALAAVEVGALCHGDLMASHILVDADRFSGVIDWGDAVVADPRWDLARFAHRADTASVSLLLEGYRPDRAASDELAWCIPLCAALWMLVDASVAHGLGRPAEATLAKAMAHLQRLPD